MASGSSQPHIQLTQSPLVLMHNLTSPETIKGSSYHTCKHDLCLCFSPHGAKLALHTQTHNPHPKLFTHNIVCHTHTTLSHTHTQLCHTHTELFHTNHSHTTLSRKTFLPTSLAHTTFHTIFVTYNSFTHTQHHTTEHNSTQQHTTLLHTHTTHTFPHATLSDTDFSHDLSSTISVLFPASPIPSSHLFCVCGK